MKRIILILLLLTAGFATLVYPQSSSEYINESIATLKKADNFMNLESYLATRSMFERLLNLEQENTIAKYHIAYCNYKISYIYLSQKDMDSFNKYMNEAIDLLKSLIASNDKDAEAMSLLATCYGIKITSDWNLAKSLGSDSQKLLATALAIEPNNPRVLLQEGISKFNSPEFFGGSKEKAMQLFKSSIEKFKELKDDKYGWGFLDAYAWYGISLSAKNQNELAAQIYTEALQLEPNFGWIKYKLLPQVKQD